MPNFVQITMDVCDSLHVQSAWAFLAMGVVLGPVFLFLNAIRDPSILKSTTSARRAAFAGIWKNMADPIDKRYAKYKKPLLGEVSGTVIDLGSGLGQNLKYFDASKVTKLYLIEPNPGMHQGLRENARKAGFRDGQLEIVGCGAEEHEKVRQLTGLGKESVDNVVSVLALCGIPDSRKVIAALYEYLKPGSKFYFFEHVASHHAPARRTQDMLTPSWKFLFGGCMLNRETDKWILEGFEWSDKQEFSVDFETQAALDPKAYGWARKVKRV